MSVITRMRKQNAVWWQRNSTANKYGHFLYAAPVEIDCRWDDTTEEFRDSKGQTVQGRAVVYVDRASVKVGDMLRRGEMDSDEPADPTTVEEAYEVRRRDRNPNFGATEELLTAFL